MHGVNQPHVPGAKYRPFQRHCTPVRLSCSARSFQFGRAYAPMIPQHVQTMRGPKAGTGIVSPKASTFIRTSWWHSSQVTEKRAHAVRPHVAERHRRAAIAVGGHLVLGVGEWTTSTARQG